MSEVTRRCQHIVDTDAGHFAWGAGASSPAWLYSPWSLAAHRLAEPSAQHRQARPRRRGVLPRHRRKTASSSDWTSLSESRPVERAATVRSEV